MTDPALEGDLAWIAGHIRMLEERLATAAEFRQVVVESVNAGARTYVAELDGVSGPTVYLTIDHTLPTIGQTVWAVRVGTSKWLHHGKLG